MSLAYQLAFSRPIVAEVTGMSGLGAIGALGRRGDPWPRRERNPNFGGLGETTNPVSQVIDSLIGGAGGIIETITGAKAQREAQAEARRVAELQAQRAIAEAQASTQLWTKALPWVAVAGVGLLGVIVLAARK